MRLADFIERNITEIVDEAEAFAKTIVSAEEPLDRQALRDHIPDMLRVMAADLRTEQTADEARRKSEGRGAPSGRLARTAAQTHAGTRAEQGFDVVQLVSEYRVLRATILRLWARRHVPDGDTIEDINRFNEAVDQAIAESVGTFAARIDRWRNVFLGVLGHELRGPLSAILIASDMLRGKALDARTSRSVDSIIAGGERMRALLSDLLDFNRISFGMGLSINPAVVDLDAACASEVELIRTTWPNHHITYAGSGQARGRFDESRVREVVWNLVSNAAKYGDAREPIRVRVEGRHGEVRISVQNAGPSIPALRREELFEPLRRASAEGATDGSLGLGLFVVKQVALAHGGDVEVRSDDGVTEFSVVLHEVAAKDTAGG